MTCRSSTVGADLDTPVGAEANLACFRRLIPAVAVFPFSDGSSLSLTPQVTIVERLEVDHTPHVSECGGVRLSVPPNSLRCGIGPITVEQTAEEVNGNYGAVREYGHDFAFFVMLAVHCLPAPCSFDAPLTLDFVVEDQRTRWWHRRAAREDALREYKVLRSTRDCSAHWLSLSLEERVSWFVRRKTLMQTKAAFVLRRI